MIRFVVYGDHQFVCETQEGYFKKVRLLRTYEYEKIVNAFIKTGYTVTFDGNNLILNGEDITFEFKNITLNAQDIKYTDKNLLALIEDAKQRLQKQAKKDARTAKIKNFWNGFKRSLGLKICVGISVSLLASALIWGTIDCGALSDLEKEKAKADRPELSISSFETGAKVADSVSVMDGILVTNSANSNMTNEKEPEQSEIAIEPVEEEPTYEEICDEYVIKYSNIFHLDKDKVLEFIHMATDNYTKNFIEVSGSSYYDVDNLESAIMVLVYNMQRDMLAIDLKDYAIPASSPYYDSEKVPSDNVYSSSFFKTDEPIVNLSEDLILANGMTYSEYLGLVSDLLGADKNYLLAICYLESGRVTSDLAMKKNNFGGLRGRNTGFFTYPTPEAGIIAYCYNLRTYAKYDFTSVEALSCRYVNGNFEVPDLLWSDNIKDIHDEITSAPEAYFLPEDEVELYTQNNDNMVRTLSNY